MATRKITESEVKFSVEATQDCIPVCGNALASGNDDEEDRKAEDEILRRLDSGDVWAWASVKVTATLTLPDGSTITGVDYLGGCCYRDESDFCQPGGYFDDMKGEALSDLQATVERQIARGELLASMFAEPIQERG